MKFPVAIHKDNESDYGVTVPDFPGCFSSGESIEEALANTVEAIELWVETAIDNKITVRFAPSKIDDLSTNADFAGAIWALVDVDPSKFDSKPERVNISAPRYILAQIDAFAESHKETRSGFMVRAALEVIQNETTESHS